MSSSRRRVVSHFRTSTSCKPKGRNLTLLALVADVGSNERAILVPEVHAVRACVISLSSRWAVEAIAHTEETSMRTAAVRLRSEGIVQLGPGPAATA